jgi:hypothetical protein
MRSTILLAGALGAMVIADGGYTATVIDTSTITVYSCGPEVSCPYHHTSTSTVAVGVETPPVGVSTPCTTTPVGTPVGSTLVTSVAPPTPVGMYFLLVFLSSTRSARCRDA